MSAASCSTVGAAELLEAAVRAHGGSERWRHVTRLRAEISVSGLFLSLKCKPRRFSSLEVTLDTREPCLALRPFPRSGQRGLFQDGDVRIERTDSTLVSERRAARSAFGGLRHLFYWDYLHLLYFSGYALWNYLSLPFLLLRPGFEVREGEPWSEDGESGRRLHVRFPPGVPTHCRDQVFYFDSSGLLRRHDYTAEVIGPWAHAAHYSWDHKDFSGLQVATKRKIFSRKETGQPRRRPELLFIAVEDVTLLE